MLLITPHDTHISRTCVHASGSSFVNTLALFGQVEVEAQHQVSRSWGIGGPTQDLSDRLGM